MTIAVPAAGEADFVPLAMRLGARMTQRGYAVKFMDLGRWTVTGWPRAA